MIYLPNYLNVIGFLIGILLTHKAFNEPKPHHILRTVVPFYPSRALCCQRAGSLVVLRAFDYKPLSWGTSSLFNSETGTSSTFKVF